MRRAVRRAGFSVALTAGNIVTRDCVDEVERSRDRRNSRSVSLRLAAGSINHAGDLDA